MENLCKSYRVAEKQLKVLDGLTVEFPEQSITVILGRSGCGKTTLLRVLGGFEEYDSGTLLRPPLHKMGMVFQEPRLMPWLTVWKNVIFGLPKAQVDPDRIRELINTVGLVGFENAYPAQLSGGMQQRAALARALAYDPELILMDEPFAALDHFIREAMQDELLRIFSVHKKSIIFVTHSIDEALLLGQKILVLDQGRVEQEFSLESFDYPRDILSPELIDVKKNIIKIITQRSIT
ncbi:ABC transporter ATP-binding protein [Ruminiclostridium cellobioparum]|uniref:ABC-type nitrate/sulfonate/bicarbonate transport system, ATPase component n=1 Tax=Ruminiclostridium cellobioparum subsp. termitidis CT1112 TaxID=1195236 RepID=S0FUG8_RUMCE|nr:ABC-type nitrate/sulfonate/bicarbonate transport system, ATPase component [Ruminiclostridium cellobioparum subsp. termitidis CT1112]